MAVLGALTLSRYVRFNTTLVIGVGYLQVAFA